MLDGFVFLRIIEPVDTFLELIVVAIISGDFTKPIQLGDIIGINSTPTGPILSIFICMRSTSYWDQIFSANHRCYNTEKGKKQLPSRYNTSRLYKGAGSC